MLLGIIIGDYILLHRCILQSLALIKKEITADTVHITKTTHTLPLAESFLVNKFFCVSMFLASCLHMCERVCSCTVCIHPRGKVNSCNFTPWHLHSAAVGVMIMKEQNNSAHVFFFSGWHLMHMINYS